MYLNVFFSSLEWSTWNGPIMRLPNEFCEVKAFVIVFCLILRIQWFYFPHFNDWFLIISFHFSLHRSEFGTMNRNFMLILSKKRREKDSVHFFYSDIYKGPYKINPLNKLLNALSVLFHVDQITKKIISLMFHSKLWSCDAVQQKQPLVFVCVTDFTWRYFFFHSQN